MCPMLVIKIICIFYLKTAEAGQVGRWIEGSLSSLEPMNQSTIPLRSGLLYRNTVSFNRKKVDSILAVINIAALGDLSILSRAVSSVKK